MNPNIAPSTLSAATRASLEQKGCLNASVLSVYDLPFSDDVPTAVTLSACGMTVTSGPPLARHKDRNSFRFDSNNNNNNNNNNGSTNNFQEPTKLVAPLRELYQATLTVRVTYSDPNKCLEAELPLRQLRIHEQKWLILTLSPLSNTNDPRKGAVSGSESGETAIQAAKVRRTSSVTEEDMSPPPTIRIKFQLSGPYRPEVATVINLATTWFGIVDKVEGGIFGSSLGKSLSSIGGKGKGFNKNLVLIPVLPLLAVTIAAFPFVAGVAAFAVPFLLPLAILCVWILGAVLVSGGLCYGSTKSGRTRAGMTLGPLVNTLVESRQGQALVYDTGPRPTPVSVCRQVLPSTIWSKLWISLVIDLVGSSSYLLPLVGEAFDLGWAPAQTILIMAMYDSTSPNLKYLSFMEEILPFTDVIPSASIGWACEYLPLLWSNHASRMDLDPKVTQAVTQLVTTAAKVVKSRKQNSGTSFAAAAAKRN